jgi:hypothetical protein
MRRGRGDIQPMQIPAARTKNLEGKTVFIVGSPRYTLTASEELQADGAAIIYSRAEIKEHGLTTYLAVQAQREIQGLDKMPDAILIYEPRMNKFDIRIEDQPTMQLAEFAQSKNIPTLIMDSHCPFTQAEQLAMQQRNVTYRDVMNLSPVPPVISNMLGKKGKDGMGGI